MSMKIIRKKTTMTMEGELEAWECKRHRALGMQVDLLETCTCNDHSLGRDDSSFLTFTQTRPNVRSLF